MFASRSLAGLAALSALLLVPPASACLWDTDTLWQERQAWPGTLELIVGKFPRHTDEFYEHRVKDRQSKLRLHAAGEQEMTPEQRAAAWDDLAVALDKLGRRDEALAALDRKQADVGEVGAYETAANRGTVLIHAGRYEEGLKEIDRALALNPDAHFGRERIQKLLVEYLLERKGDAEKVPLPLAPSDAETNFAVFLHKRGVSIAEGRKGVEGMMRFGDYRSPVLLEALGDLLSTSGKSGEIDGSLPRRLAGRAYLAAGRAAPEAREEYRELAVRPLAWQSEDGKGIDFEDFSQRLEREFAETEAWFEKVREDEELWVAVSPDPDARFREKYGVAVLRVGDTSARPNSLQAQWSAKRSWALDVAVGVGGALTIAAIWGLIAWRRRQPNGWDAN
ncbi:tetratricopeptide repeat protein [Alienimonas californiensis]|uniref:Tetratricopeptide repeat protein n=1 Tax=Alienimonas californiensis TaxID=2527989 RepID=A0A517PA94_9PLAN|nr:hypothetical protein [Alienimonas californiensis]QDT16293.1 Tetratricopeptide repeat protein [Alienimonas californiensis]